VNIKPFYQPIAIMTDKIMHIAQRDNLATLLSDSAIEGGVFLIDKPLEWTSFAVVNKLRHRLTRLFKNKKYKVGHAGTLDPLATGLLIVCFGKMTKQIDSFMGLPKAYTGTIKLGETTPSYDAETEVNARFPIDHITPSVLEAARLPFLGDIDQMPPIFSAIKKDGKPLYESARQGLEVEMQTRRVSIHQFDIQQVTESEIRFLVRCSKGTYIRSLAYDFGKACGSGGYLTQLCRSEIGEFQNTDAWQLDDLVAQLEKITHK
jgi:tRNA pseudouridine55 synthase